jgi:hypothetical protein
MAAPSVAPFELICLENDAPPAEVAACHQILSLVLTKAADIDPPLRARVYKLAPP